MSQIISKVRTIQANTGKEKFIGLSSHFTGMKVFEFRKQVADQEHVPISSIQLVDYDIEKYSHEYSKDTEININGLYTNNIVKY